MRAARELSSELGFQRFARDTRRGFALRAQDGTVSSDLQEKSYESRIPGVILCDFQLCRIIAAWKTIAIRQSNDPTHCLLTGFLNFCSITLHANRRVSACVGFRLSHSPASVSWAQLGHLSREELVPAVASESLPLRTNGDFFDHLPIIA